MQSTKNNSLRNTTFLIQNSVTNENNIVQNDEINVQDIDINNHCFKDEYQSCICSDECSVCFENFADSECIVDQLIKFLISNQELFVNATKKKISTYFHSSIKITVRRKKHIK